jgi:imidazolonepropionase
MWRGVFAYDTAMNALHIVNARAATLAGGRYSIVENAGIVTNGERIAWIGPMREMRPGAPGQTLDAQGGLVTPGLVDCHTHLVYAGNRAVEHEQRLRGASYEEIARAGGGIVSTVRATRAATAESLRRQSRVRLEALAASGVTTVEIKSGYGLDVENELKCLRVARSLGSDSVRVVTTLLGAHAVPPEFAGRSDEYVEKVCTEMIPAAAKEGLADAVDAFCEGIGFSPGQTRRVFECAAAHGLRVKLHADQLSDLGGAQLAAEFGALSADHLEHTGEAGVAAMARAGTVAVLLPGAFYFLRETRRPPVEALRRHGVAMAVASDCNPGTSPIASAGIILNMACTLFGLTPEEALAGMTIHAARALGMEGEIGSLEAGKRADVVIWDASQPAELATQVGMIAPRAVIFGGRLRQA